MIYKIPIKLGLLFIVVLLVGCVSTRNEKVICNYPGNCTVIQYVPASAYIIDHILEIR